MTVEETNNPSAAADTTENTPEFDNFVQLLNSPGKNAQENDDSSMDESFLAHLEGKGTTTSSSNNDEEPQKTQTSSPKIHSEVRSALPNEHETSAAAAATPEKKRSGCEAVGDKVDENISGFFYKLGYFCSFRPKLTIAITMFIAIICAMGMAKLNTENRPEKVSVPCNILIRGKKCFHLLSRDISTSNSKQYIFTSYFFCIFIALGPTKHPSRTGTRPLPKFLPPQF